MASTSATWMGGLAMTATIAAFLVYLRRTVFAEFVDAGGIDSSFVVQTVGYVSLMSLLTFSAFMYLLGRQGALHRSRQHARVPRAEIDAHFADARDAITVLVPSYKEDADVVRMTLLSAALQEFPSLRVVLLLDDPPNPQDDGDRASLEACRALPAEVDEYLRVPRERVSLLLEQHELRALVGGAASPDELRALAAEFEWTADWLATSAQEHPRTTTQEAFVADEVLAALGEDVRRTGDALAAAADADVEMSWDRLCQFARRLAWTFQADFAVFERKRYAQLSHEANKAMNLNAYLSLMGGSYREVPTRTGVVLRRTDDDADLVIPATPLVLTLDADSVLLREYCLRLAYYLELPGNERIAVIQTPYSAIRGAMTRVERIAGATTDLQHELHQGMSYYDATFWVGANALIRRAALEDIVEVSYVNGIEERRYIQDRTVIEDTESSIDLVAHGWSLYNYGERLSYSATPPDFGSLAVQRGRWANGGLLILPSYWRYLRQARRNRTHVRFASIALRVNYMASVAWASVGLVALLVLPFNSRLLSPALVAAALPYFAAMSSDLHRLGYKRTDALRVYGFNLVLLAVNLVGVLKSLQQAAAKSKIPFARTPKVQDRTATPALMVLSAVLIVAFSFWVFQRDLVLHNWGNAAFAAFNGLLTAYAIVAFMGVRNALVDIVKGAAAWVRVPVAPKPTADDEAAADWEDVLYFGPSSATANARRTSSTPPMSRRRDTRSRHRGTAADRIPTQPDASTEVTR